MKRLREPVTMEYWQFPILLLAMGLLSVGILGLMLNQSSAIKSVAMVGAGIVLWILSALQFQSKAKQ